MRLRKSVSEGKTSVYKTPSPERHAMARTYDEPGAWEEADLGPSRARMKSCFFNSGYYGKQLEGLSHGVR